MLVHPGPQLRQVSPITDRVHSPTQLSATVPLMDHDLSAFLIFYFFVISTLNEHLCVHLYEPTSLCPFAFLSEAYLLQVGLLGQRIVYVRFQLNLFSEYLVVDSIFSLSPSY